MHIWLQISEILAQPKYDDLSYILPLSSSQPSNPLFVKSITRSSWKGTNKDIFIIGSPSEKSSDLTFRALSSKSSVTRPVVTLHLILSQLQQSEVLLSTHETRMASANCISLTDFMKVLISIRPILSLSKQLLSPCIWTKAIATHNENLHMIKYLPIVIDFASNLQVHCRKLSLGKSI